MTKRYIMPFCLSVLLFPTIVWAGFFSRDPVVGALDDYETGRNAARQKMSVKTEDAVEYRETEQPQANGKVGGTARERKTFETEIGSETYAYHYEETVGGERFISMRGTFYGIYLKETFRPNQLDPFYSDLMDFYRFEGRVAWARQKYNGGVQDGAGNRVADLDMSHIPDVVLESRVLVGKDLTWRGYTFTPYSGFGFRFLKDDPSDTSGTFTYLGTEYSLNGYLRKSYYYYLPFGVDVKKPLTESLQIGLNAEFDYLLQGYQKSYTQADDNEVTTNKQPSGWGLRTSVRLEWDHQRWGLSVEPFYRYWDIENSELEQTGPCIVGVGCPVAQEPSNTSKELGVKMGLTF